MYELVGSWNKNKYFILQKIGKGGVGTVYKALDANDNIRAIKISNDIFSISREFHVVNELNFHSIPRVYDLDDCEIQGKTYHFFVMDYIQGKNLKEIIDNESIGMKNVLGIGYILVNILNILYNIGYIYTDIKLTNILIDENREKLYLVDFGSLIDKNSSIKEYTPCYTTFSWTSSFSDALRCSIFSVTMIMVSLIFKREFDPLIYDLDDIVVSIERLNIDNSIKRLLIKGLKGGFSSFDEYNKNLNKLYCELDKKKGKIKKDKVDYLFLCSIIFFVFAIIIGIKF